MKITYLLALILFTSNLVAVAQGQSNYSPRLMIPYRSGQLWGYCDTLGKEILKPQYDSVGFFDVWQGTAAIFKQNGKYGLIDTRFSVVVAANYEALQAIGIGWRKCLVLSVNGKKGMIDIKGDTVIPFIYDDLDLNYTRLGSVLLSKQGKWGAFNLANNQTIQPEYDRIEVAQYYRDIRGGHVGAKAGQYFHIKPDGTVVPVDKVDKYAESLPDKSTLATLPPEQQLPEKIRNQLKLAEPALKDTAHITRILFNRPMGYTLGEHGYILVEKNKKVAALSISSKRIISDYYDDIVDLLRFDIVSMELTEEPAPPQPYYRLMLVKKDNKYGVVNERGKTVFPFVYDGFGTADSGHIITKQKKKQGAITLMTIYPPIPCKYDKINFERPVKVTNKWYFGIYQVTLNGQTGYVGENGIEYFK